MLTGERFVAFVAARTEDKTPLGQWKGYALFGILLFINAFGILAFVPSAMTAFSLEQWPALSMFTLAYALALYILLSKRIPFKLRAYVLCLFTLGLGMNSLFAFGLHSSGRLWMVCATLLASLLIGFRHALFFAVFSIACLIAAGFSFEFVGATPAEQDIRLWVVVITTFVLINVIIVAASAVLIHGLLVSLRNESELAEECRVAKDEAERSNRFKTEFLANMSHEIRTPINGVLGMLQLLENSNLADKQRQYSSIAVNSCKRLVNLVEDILDISRIEAGVMRLRNEDFTIRDILRSVLDLFGPAADHKGLRLSLDLDETVPHVLHGDSTRLHQILSNLVGNALKFTEHGSVDIAVRPVEPASSGTMKLELVVADTGRGIPEDMREMVFNSFTQVDDIYTRDHSGAGLGLAIVKHLVTLMGGTVAMRSVEEQGTTFMVELPFEVPQQDTGISGAVARPAQASKESVRVLLVEDDLANRLYVSEFLRMEGSFVHEAGNGEQALQALREGEFDLVLMDIQMPVMNGIDAVRAIRTDAEFADKADIPVYALTAYAMKGDREKFMGAGMTGYFPKPIDIKQLRKVLESVDTTRTS